MLCFDLVTCYLNQGNEGDKHELYKSTWVIKRGFIIIDELRKMSHLFSNNIDWEILGQEGMRFEKSFKSYSNDQWLWCREQTWFNMVDIQHALMLNKNIIDERILITLRNWSLKC
jgi:hypothetical protein